MPFARWLQEYTEQKWGEGCWWGKHVICYGDEGLKRGEPAAADGVGFCLGKGQAGSVSQTALNVRLPRTCSNASHLPRLTCRLRACQQRLAGRPGGLAGCTRLAALGMLQTCLML